jgi:predicted nuclease of predicted toxin-antitoxin system
VKLLLDECIDWRLARELPGHDVKSARQMGWSSVKNGELMKLAATAFDAFVTVDRNLSFQQHLSNLPISVVVLRCYSNRLSELKALVPELMAALPNLPERQVMMIG